MRCKHEPKTYWLCSGCGSDGCRRCFAFKCPTVTFCVACVKSYLGEHNITNMKEFEKRVRRYVEIGDILLRVAKRILSKKIQ